MNKVTGQEKTQRDLNFADTQINGDRTILITGASRGLGRALVGACSSRGWKTVPLVRNAQVAERMQTEFPNCCPIIGDVTSNEVETVVTRGLRRIGPIHVLINNAGIPGRTTRIDSVTPAEIADLFQTHCLGALRCTKAALPLNARPPGPMIATTEDVIVDNRGNIFMDTYHDGLYVMRCPV